MFSTKLSGFLIFCCIPLVLAYAVGSPLISKRLPDPLGSGLLAFHEEMNAVAQTGVTNAHYGEVIPIRAIQAFFARMKKEVSRS